jgi:hypothetical protein
MTRRSLRGLAILLPLLALGMAFAKHAPDNIKVQLNGTTIRFDGSGPEEVDNRVLVPLRGVFEAMGASVDYAASTQVITARRGDVRVVLTIGVQRATINDRPQVLDVPPLIRSNRTLIPLRFVSEALGATVRWSDADQTVFITDTTNPGDRTNPSDTHTAGPGPPEQWIDLQSDPHSATIYLVSEFDWETIPNIANNIDKDPDLEVIHRVSEGDTNTAVQRDLVVYRAIFVLNGMKKVAVVQPAPIRVGVQRKARVTFP